jgi:hypothetical protein
MSLLNRDLLAVEDYSVEGLKLAGVVIWIGEYSAEASNSASELHAEVASAFLGQRASSSVFYTKSYCRGFQL